MTNSWCECWRWSSPHANYLNLIKRVCWRHWPTGSDKSTCRWSRCRWRSADKWAWSSAETKQMATLSCSFSWGMGKGKDAFLIVGKLHIAHVDLGLHFWWMQFVFICQLFFNQFEQRRFLEQCIVGFFILHVEMSDNFFKEFLFAFSQSQHYDSTMAYLQNKKITSYHCFQLANSFAERSLSAWFWIWKKEDVLSRHSNFRIDRMQMEKVQFLEASPGGHDLRWKQLTRLQSCVRLCRRRHLAAQAKKMFNFPSFMNSTLFIVSIVFFRVMEFTP